MPDHSYLRHEPSGIAYHGGGERIRTDDPLVANQVLSPLSYTPKSMCALMVGLGRFELPTSRLSGVRSHRLSYRPVAKKKIVGWSDLQVLTWM